MKPARKTRFDRFLRKGSGAQHPRDGADERKEALVLLAIAVLFVANVVLYLCHHYGFTSLNQFYLSSPMPHRAEVSERVLAGWNLERL